MAAVAADMDAERQAGRLRRRVDRPIAPPPQRLVRARANVDLHILAGSRAALDLGHRRLGIVLADDDRRLEPGLGFAPTLDLPIVDGALKGDAELRGSAARRQEVEYLQDAELDINWVEVLLAHEVKVRSRRPPVGGHASLRQISGEERG